MLDTYIIGWDQMDLSALFQKIFYHGRKSLKINMADSFLKNFSFQLKIDLKFISVGYVMHYNANLKALQNSNHYNV